MRPKRWIDPSDAALGVNPAPSEKTRDVNQDRQTAGLGRVFG